MFEAAAQTALATADPAALCARWSRPARSSSRRPVWPLADGDVRRAGGRGRARRRADRPGARPRRHGGIDLLLAEKVVGAGAETRRAVDIDGRASTSSTPWRFGLASATGLEIPGAADRRRRRRTIRAWLARAPMVPLEQRLGAASTAASLGVFSSHALVELYSLMLDQTDPAEIGGHGRRAAAHRLGRARRRRADGGDAQPLAESEAPRERHARLILTAGAAARIPVSDDLAGDADDLIASMLTAGMDRAGGALGARSIEQSGDGDRAWALLAVGAPRPTVDVGAGRIEAFVGADDSRAGGASQLLVAGARRARPDQRRRRPRPRGVPARRRAIAGPRRSTGRRASGAPGTVALLAGVGMQTARLVRACRRDHLFQIVRALRAVGLEYEARMIAAEAVARL